MDSCKTCKENKKLHKNGFCSTACFNKTKIKSIDGYKKCLLCQSEFPYRESLKVRSCFSKKFNCFIGSVNQKYCSQKCSIMDKNINNNPAKTESGRLKISLYAKNRSIEHLLTPEVREKQRKSISGEKHWNWQNGKTPIDKKIRVSIEYKQWRKSVFERDDYTCVFCKARSCKGKSVTVHADHIKPFAHFPELRFELSNGRTLCVECHRKTDTYGNRKGNKCN